MGDSKMKEIFELASEAKANLNSLEYSLRNVKYDLPIKNFIDKIRDNLENIERKSEVLSVNES